MLTCRIKDVYKELDHKGNGIWDAIFFFFPVFDSEEEGREEGLWAAMYARMPDTVLFVCV